VAIERYLVHALAELPSGAGSSLFHVVGGETGGGYEWQAAPAYRASVRRGISASTLGQARQNLASDDGMGFSSE
jgi:hypothetical protein